MTEFVTRHMIFRPRTGTELGTPKELFISISAVELHRGTSAIGPYRCVVSTPPSERGPVEIFGKDPISALITALGSVESYCQMLNVLGELRLEDGQLYDPETDGLSSVVKRIWDKDFVPPFLSKHP